MESSRNAYFDTLKYVLIVLVVLGHVCDLDMEGNCRFYFFQYFHIPLFVFVSGYFTHVTNKERFWKSQLKIAETLVVFHVIFTVLWMIWKGWPPRYMWVTPFFALWYLLSLLYWRLLAYVCHEKLKKVHPFWIIAASFAISLLSGWVPIDSQLSFQRSCVFLPFFIMGFYASDRYLLPQRLPSGTWSKVCAVAVILAIFLWTYTHVRLSVGSLYSIASSYGELARLSKIPAFQVFLLRALHLVFAALLSYSVLLLVPRTQMSLSRWGSRTLFILIYHIFFIRALRVYWPSEWPANIGVCLLLTLLIMLAVHGLYHVKALRWFLNPFTNFYEKRRAK